MKKKALIVLCIIILPVLAFAQYIGGSYDGYAMSEQLTDSSLPVTLTLFTTVAGNGKVILHWETASESENLGFILERSNEHKASWCVIASYKTHATLRGQGNTSSRTEYTFTDNTVEAGHSYYYRLSDVSYDGKVEYHGIREITVKSYNEVVPGQFLLKAVYPNPFNPTTNISYILGEEADMSIFIMDLRGSVVKQLISSKKHPEGSYSLNWDGGNDNGIKLSSGVYFIVMKANAMTTSKKIVLLR